MKKLRPLLFAGAIAAVVTACSPPQKTTESAPAPLLKDTLSLETAKRLVINYNGRANHVIKNGKTLPDARCIWFSADQLRALIAKIDKEKGDGIRFYLAAYDKTVMPDLKMNPAYLDYTTLVMVSTHDSLGKHYDYYTNVKAKGAMIMANPENQGELCPPPEKCTTVGADLVPDPPLKK